MLYIFFLMKMHVLYFSRSYFTLITLLRDVLIVFFEYFVYFNFIFVYFYFIFVYFNVIFIYFNVIFAYFNVIFIFVYFNVIFAYCNFIFVLFLLIIKRLTGVDNLNFNFDHIFGLTWLNFRTKMNIQYFDYIDFNDELIILLR